MITRHDIFLRENKFSIYVCPNKEINFHSHNYLELGYVLKGEAIHSWGEDSFLIKEGDYFVVDYNSAHSYVARTKELELINCIFLPEFIDPALAHCRSFLEVISNYQIRFNSDLLLENPSIKIYRDEDKRIKKLLNLLLDEFALHQPGYMQIIHSMVIELLILTTRKIYFNPDFVSKNSFSDNVLKYLHTHYMDNITLTEVAAALNYSPAYLSMKFKKELGISFTKYLQKTRIEQSMRLLAHTDKSISEIAADVGYRDLKTYYTLFKSFSNSSPAKFRKNHSPRNNSPE
ncbi:MAG: helix-turn-helix domain-containing protein [Oscillospiraceae bacterium]|nr:helix-turn-helix domain-containing protein [Oscillospiraceae bacterium]MBQ7120586.1 helix-turn-helix domain-containing protein [Oscillospiraceae bacterium]